MKKLTVIILLIVLLFTFSACSLLQGLGGTGNGNGDNGDNTNPPIDDSTNPPDDDDDDNNDPVTPPDDDDDDGKIEAPVFPENYPYEFGDAVSYKNDSFYKDYSTNEKNLYYLLWKETTTVNIKVEIEPSELAKINEAYEDYKKGNTAKADTYRKCNLTIIVNGEEYTYEEVGIRMRGNTSRAKFLDNDGYINNYVHFRFSLTETFDGEEYEGNAWGKEAYHDWSSDSAGRKERKNRSFATMEKFYYKWNKNYDQTYIREVYANRMFQAYGILAPHITLTQFQMKQNGKTDMLNLGVGNLYETVDKAFIKRNFDKASKGGDLYKCGWGGGAGADLSTLTKDSNPLYGIETATKSYTYNLKTNDDDTNQHNYLKAFINMLQTDQNASNFKTKLEAMVDMDYFTRFEAVNYLLGNPDCIRNNYNNYYIYFVPVTNGNYASSKTYIIPYDYDRCLGANMDWNPKNSMVDVTPYSKHGTQESNNPLYNKTILRDSREDYRAMYKQNLQMVLSGEWFTYSNYKKLFDAYQKNYKSLTTPSQLIQQKCGENIKFSRFTFKIEESSDTSSTSENLSVSTYFTRKRATATNGING